MDTATDDLGILASEIFTPAMRKALQARDLIRAEDFILLETTGELLPLCRELHKEWGIGQSQLDRLMGFVAGLIAMGEWLNLSRH